MIPQSKLLASAGIILGAALAGAYLMREAMP